jgi:mono/diheme cytochrome c family protein
MRLPALLALSALAACGGDPGSGTGGGSPSFSATAELAAVQGRCVTCHDAGPERAARFAPHQAPTLAGIGTRATADWLTGFLAGHYGGSPAEAADLTAFLRERSGVPSLAAAAIGGSQIDQGGRLFAEAGCAACHTAEPEGLASKTDLDRLASFLVDPRSTRPDLRTHDFGLDGSQAQALAAWLLRSQLVDAGDAPPAAGLICECFEMKIPAEGIPEVDSVTPSFRGRADTIDIEHRTRKLNYALRFTGSVQVPAGGKWTFHAGADDSAWLWIDGEMVVRNPGHHPFQVRSGSVELAPGWHDFALLFTQAGGGDKLTLEWEGPTVERQAIPTAALSARTETLVPPSFGTEVDAAAAARGAEAFTARRCGACHTDEGFVPSASSPALDAVLAAGTGACPGAPADVVAAARPAFGATTAERAPKDELRYRMQRDGCLSCHVRDGEGGMSAAAQEGLVEVEDLGEEGRLPPELTKVGHRLRRSWIEAVLKGEVDARAYVRARMPHLSDEEAAEYAALFEAVDAEPGDDVEPVFSTEAAAEGRRIAGNDGFACIACHAVAGFKSTGPQGMDLAIQHERLKPVWFREWLLSPSVHRPGTRMPTFWPVADDKAKSQADAVRVWSSLGNVMPLPKGIGGSDSTYVLESDGDRPRLHGAFLDGLSARCMAVGTPERTHYAYDLANARLAWLWRGAFMDAKGTWDGRAGQLIRPLGEDWVTLPEGPSIRGADGATAVVTGHRLDPDGYPIWRLRVGSAAVEDHPRPRWFVGGSELVRRVSSTGGSVVLVLPPADGSVQAIVDGSPVTTGELEIGDGQTVEVIYRW